MKSSHQIKVENDNTDTLLFDRPTPQYAIHNVYDMASTGKTVRYLHAALGFPTKSTILKTIQNKCLLSFPSIIASYVNAFLQSQKIPIRGIWISKDRDSVQQNQKNAQADQLKDDNIETNITPANHRKQKDLYCKFGTWKKQYTLNILENFLCNKVEDTDTSLLWWR